MSRGRRRCATGAALLAFTLAGAGPGAAIVGPSQESASIARGMVMVLNRTGRTAGFCSGIVVAPDAVLTAAHCVPPGADLRVHYRDEARPVLREVVATMRSAGYRADAIVSRQRSVDLALLRLAEPLPASFTPATLATGTPAHAPGTPFRLAGFGVSREGEGASGGVLRVAAVAARAPASDLLLWAADPSKRGGGACTGDSGGAVLGSSDEVVGVIAWAAGAGKAGCGDLTQAVWIGPQRGWIDSVLQGWAGKP